MMEKRLLIRGLRCTMSQTAVNKNYCNNCFLTDRVKIKIYRSIVLFNKKLLT